MGRRVATSPVLVRVAAADDAAAVRSVHEAAFPTPAEARLVEALAAGPAALPAFSLVAVDHDAVVGHLLASRLRVGDGDALALAPLAVVPSHQRVGVGTALVEAFLGAASLAGERLVVVLGDPAFYGRFGFTPARDLGVSTPYGDGDEVQALALPGAGDPPRGRATYPEEFAALTA